MLVRSVLEEEDTEQYLPLAGVTGEFDLSHISEDRQLQVRTICCRKVFQEKPGGTDLVEDNTVHKESASVRILSYRIPKPAECIEGGGGYHAPPGHHRAF